jgi:hypothetical protein
MVRSLRSARERFWLFAGDVLKLGLLAALVVLGSGTAFAYALKLESLKPAKISELKLGTLNARLVSVADGRVLSILTGALGDCKGCIRGLSMTGDLGIRIEGNDMDSLRFVRKQSAKVLLTNCALDKQRHSSDVSCSFDYNRQSLKLILKIAR